MQSLGTCPSDVDEPFSKLTVIVNGMLDEMETMIHALAGVGNDIAHDLRTPLTRARLALERGRTNATTLEQLQTVVDKAIANIDQSLSIITAPLRLAAIENSRRSAAFGGVPLHEMLQEVCDIYEPIAENKRIDLRAGARQRLSVRGDRDLLFEAVANLVDNAIKFTPEGGRVDVELIRGGNETIVRVSDTGSGISDQEREAVLRRFYRSDKIRNMPGVGLGLSLVAAIVKLHGFRLAIIPDRVAGWRSSVPTIKRRAASGWAKFRLQWLEQWSGSGASRQPRPPVRAARRTDGSFRAQDPTPATP